MSQLSNEIKSDFPIFEGSDLVYLDNAATTQKPQSVLDSINSSYTEPNANVHRALYSLGAKATEKYEGARKKYLHSLVQTLAKKLYLLVVQLNHLTCLHILWEMILTQEMKSLFLKWNITRILFLGNSWQKELIL